ncbi:MAG: hypothetical protein J5700_07030 [Treponema sp.]|nr:hypothetical protein [Treponema sp.]
MAKSGLTGLNWIVKIILVIIGDIYGILRRLTSGSLVPIIIGIVQLASLVLVSYNRLVGIVACIFWIIDLVTVIINKEVTVLA